MTLVERKSGFVLIGKMKARTALEANRAMLEFMGRHPTRLKTITADNGTEFHSYDGGAFDGVGPCAFGQEFAQVFELHVGCHLRDQRERLLRSCGLFEMGDRKADVLVNEVEVLYEPVDGKCEARLCGINV